MQTTLRTIFRLGSLIGLGGVLFLFPQQILAQCSTGEVAVLENGSCQCAPECSQSLCQSNGQLLGSDETCVGDTTSCNSVGAAETCNNPDANTNQSTGNQNGGSSGDGPLVEGLGNIMDALPSTMTEGTLGTFVINLINWFLGILGIVFIIIVLYAGFKYMRSENAQGTQEAISLITNAIIGLIIIMGAYLITQYIASALT